MKLSFVIPAHNEESCIAECLASVIEHKNQSGYDIEIIVVNNASVDATEKIAKSFEGVRVVNEPKKGLARARQAGFNASTGNLIANVDADNRLTRQWIEKAMKAFEADEKLIALSGPLLYEDVPKQVILITNFFYYLAFLTYLMNRFVLKTSSMLQGGNFVVRREALQKIGGYDTDIYFYGEDADIARRLNRIGKVKFTFDFPMYSSGRRLIKEGVLKIGLRYTLNYFWIILFKRPFTSAKATKEIRL